MTIQVFKGSSNICMYPKYAYATFRRSDVKYVDEVEIEDSAAK